ncbi:hypothetical protein [Luteolibacter luteus]|uniref:Uncharacterized protein n=1 Tax=Luteolibacter luteus TaxID=2728835 RepID=A0A858RSG4_9BACT|nr:hypothetical protein [Luteolibacter luteus]QJE99140.1 hypothetical protein HHL09_26285 [Luteolibacter luteus]
MKPRPLYRSLTCWSGMLAMGFVCWAWWDSMTRESFLRTPNYQFTHFAGLAAVEYESSSWRSVPFEVDRSITILDAGIAPFGSAAFERGGDRNSSANPIEPLMGFKSPEDWILLLPHWLILLAVALLWSTLLVWRARRIRRVGSIDPGGRL